MTYGTEARSAHINRQIAPKSQDALREERPAEAREVDHLNAIERFERGE